MSVIKVDNKNRFTTKCCNLSILICWMLIKELLRVFKKAFKPKVQLVHTGIQQFWAAHFTEQYIVEKKSTFVFFNLKSEFFYRDFSTKPLLVWNALEKKRSSKSSLKK